MKIRNLVLAVALIAVTGCGTFWLGRDPGERHASSVVKFLYPNSLDHVDKPGVPVLTLPLRVGVAFVPEDTARRTEHFSKSPGLSEQEKVSLLRAVSDEFRKYPFVKSIEVIPSAYLRPEGSFENLDQLRSMFGVDVIALVSYDQLQFTGTTRWSLAYLTVVGAYLIDAERNDTHTMLDAVVYDIASRKLLFRAPGLSEVNGSSNPINFEEQLRADRVTGFHRASSNLVVNVDQELAAFRQRIQEKPEEVKIVRSPGYTGAGGAGLFELLAVVALAAVAWRMPRS